jgi:hypothetical protein
MAEAGKSSDRNQDTEPRSLRLPFGGFATGPFTEPPYRRFRQLT